MKRIANIIGNNLWLFTISLFLIMVLFVDIIFNINTSGLSLNIFFKVLLMAAIIVYLIYVSNVNWKTHVPPAGLLFGMMAYWSYEMGDWLSIWGMKRTIYFEFFLRQFILLLIYLLGGLALAIIIKALHVAWAKIPPRTITPAPQRENTT